MSSRLVLIAIITSISAVVTAHPNILNGARARLINREACYDDDVWQALEAFPEDTDPFCRSLLAIQDVTQTAPPTTVKTTLSSLVATIYETPDITVTDPATTYITTTVTIDNINLRGVVQKRAGASLSEKSVAQSLMRAVDYNAVLATSVSSACSCRRLTTSTVEVTPTITSVRTIIGTEYEQARTVAAATVVITTSVLATPLSPFHGTGLSTSLAAPSVGTLSPASSGTYTPPFFNNTTHAPYTSPNATVGGPTASSYPSSIASSAFFPKPSANITIRPSVSLKPPSSIANVTLNPTAATGLLTAASSGPFPSPSANRTVRPSGSLRPPFSVANVTLYPTAATGLLTAASSGFFPTPSANVTIRPSGSLRPPVSTANVTLIPTAATGLLTALSSGFVPSPASLGSRTSFPASLLPPLPSNEGSLLSSLLAPLTSVLPPLPTNGGSLLPPLPTNGGSLLPSLLAPLSSVSIPTSVATLVGGSRSASTSLGPIASSISPPVCPSENATIFETPYGDQYQIQCSRQYIDTGLFEVSVSNFEDCIGECSTRNQGFSDVSCYGVTWTPSVAGALCNLKIRSDFERYTTDDFAVSAILLTGVGDPVGTF